LQGCEARRNRGGILRGRVILEGVFCSVEEDASSIEEAMPLFYVLICIVVIGVSFIIKMPMLSLLFHVYLEYIQYV
jgi:hypothetical protein